MELAALPMACRPEEQPGHRLPWYAGREARPQRRQAADVGALDLPGAGRSQHYVVDLTYSQLGHPLRTTPASSCPVKSTGWVRCSPFRALAIPVRP